MTDRITLTGLRGRGHHGVLPAERRDGQDFLVDVVLHLDARRAAATDDLADTVDYGSLATEVVAVVEGEPVDLIETLAVRILELCVGRAGVQRAEVTVHKPQAPVTVPFDDVSVTVAGSAPAPPRQAVMALGANLGDRFAALQGAVRALAAQEGLQVLAASGVYETAPVGGPEQPAYLNAVVRCETSLAPTGLLAAAHRVEAAYDRVRTVRWGPRTLDVDLVAVDGVTLASEALTLPHPRAYERAFVLLPWLEVEPDAVLPGHGRVAELAASLPADGLRRVEDLVLAVPCS